MWCCLETERDARTQYKHVQRVPNAQECTHARVCGVNRRQNADFAYKISVMQRVRTWRFLANQNGESVHPDGPRAVLPSQSLFEKQHENIHAFDMPIRKSRRHSRCKLQHRRSNDWISNENNKAFILGPPGAFRSVNLVIKDPQCGCKRV